MGNWRFGKTQRFSFPHHLHSGRLGTEALTPELPDGQRWFIRGDAKSSSPSKIWPDPDLILWTDSGLNDCLWLLQTLALLDPSHTQEIGCELSTRPMLSRTAWLYTGLTWAAKSALLLQTQRKDGIKTFPTNKNGELLLPASPHSGNTSRARRKWSHMDAWRWGKECRAMKRIKLWAKLNEYQWHIRK